MTDTTQSAAMKRRALATVCALVNELHSLRHKQAMSFAALSGTGQLG